MTISTTTTLPDFDALVAENGLENIGQEFSSDIAKRMQRACLVRIYSTPEDLYALIDAAISIPDSECVAYHPEPHSIELADDYAAHYITQYKSILERILMRRLTDSDIKWFVHSVREYASDGMSVDHMAKSVYEYLTEEFGMSLRQVSCMSWK